VFSRDVKFYESVFPFKDKNLLLSQEFSEYDNLDTLTFFDEIEQTTPTSTKCDLPPDDDFRVDKNVNDTVESVSLRVQQPGVETRTVHGEAEQQPDSSGSNTGGVGVEKVDRDKGNSPEGGISQADTRTSLRRSTRESVLPKALNDYIIEGKVKFGLEKVVNYANLSQENRCFAIVFVTPRPMAEIPRHDVLGSILEHMFIVK
jgi:hypothetical protein